MRTWRKTAALVTAVTAAALVLSGCSAIGALIPRGPGAESASTSQEPADLPAKPKGTVAGMGAQQPNWRDCTGGLLQVAKAVYEGALAGSEAAKALRKG